MEKKTISINPKLFDVTKNGKTNKSEKKKPKGIIKPNTLKRQLIQKIKKHKKEHSNQHEKANTDSNHQESKAIETDESDFNNAMKDLSDIVKNVKDHKKTLKKAKIPSTCVPPLLRQTENNSTVRMQSSSPEVSIILPDALSMKSDAINPANITVSTTNNVVPQNNTAPAWGCLKGGNKPTYKTWKNNNRPQNSNNINKITIVDTEPMKSEENVGSFTYREKRLQEIKNKMKERENDKAKAKSHLPSKKLKRTVKNVYTLGKKGKSIKVLIKNNKTRKNNQIEKNIIEQTDPKDMKLYLKKQGLLSSAAPMDVMRDIRVVENVRRHREQKQAFY